jgi:hypothetical protein
MVRYADRFSASSISTSPRGQASVVPPAPAKPAEARSPASSAPSEAAPAPAPPAAAPTRQRFATVTVTGIDHDVVLSGERMVVGRLTSCDICLKDRNVSRQHAAFVAEGSGWAITDLGSTNGTLLNGSTVSSRTLRDGDVVTVGVTELVYHGPGA